MEIPRPGDFFAGYRLEQELGEGGFAVVYRALDVDGRPVAIKILKPSEESYLPLRVARFEREIEAVSRLRSPCTVTLLTHGRSPEGLLYIVFELVGGNDLSLLMLDAPIDPDVVRHILEQVLESLSEAHASGVVHRDIKPANIRIYESMGDPHRAKVLDFGVARPLDADATALTAAGNVVGTVRFMAPEQIFGGELSPSSDLYSLGLVAFELLTGRPSNHLRVVSRHKSVGLSGNDTDDAGLILIVNRMLQTNPEHRFETAAEALAAFRAGDVVTTAPRESLAERQKRNARAEPPRMEPRQPVLGPAPTRSAPEPDFDMRWVVAGLSALAVVFTGSVWLASKRNRAERPAVRARLVSAPLVVERPVDSDEPDAVAAVPPDGCGRKPPFRGEGDLTVISGLERESVHAYVPTSYRGDQNIPLVILLHDFGGTPQSALVNATGLVELANAKGFAIVVPDGGVIGSWLGKNDAEKVLPAVNLVRDRLCIDEDRIYALGQGDGGVMVEQLPCLMKLAGTATSAHRHRVGTAECDAPLQPTPHLMLSPLADGYNPVEGGRGCSGAHRISLAEKEKRWQKRAECSPKREVVLESDAAKCFAYDGCAAPYVSCHLNGGHNWPGVKRDIIDIHRCDGTPANFAYAQTIWHFFETGGELPE